MNLIKKDKSIFNIFKKDKPTVKNIKEDVSESYLFGYSLLIGIIIVIIFAGGHFLKDFLPANQVLAFKIITGCIGVIWMVYLKLSRSFQEDVGLIGFTLTAKDENEDEEDEEDEDEDESDEEEENEDDEE